MRKVYSYLYPGLALYAGVACGESVEFETANRIVQTLSEWRWERWCVDVVRPESRPASARLRLQLRMKLTPGTKGANGWSFKFPQQPEPLSQIVNASLLGTE